MASDIITWVPPVDFVADGEITNALEHESLWKTAEYGDFHRGHQQADTSVVTIQSTALAGPKTGELRMDTSTTPHTLREYDGSSEVAVAADHATSAPATTVSGNLWFDPTLKLLRVYDTRDSIAGWHPVFEGYQLMHNRSGGGVSAGDVVVRDTTGSTNREFKRTTSKKDQSVIGVAMETISAAAAGVIALVSSGATVNVNVDETDGAVVKGDGLVSYSTAGKARTVGELLAVNAILDGGITRSTMGTPMGCFAEAVGIASSGVVRARLLGFVGSGAEFRNPKTNLVLSMTEGVNTEVDASGVVYTSKHLPIAGVFIIPSITDDGGGGGASVDIDLSLRNDGSNTSLQFKLQGGGNTSGVMAGAWSVGFMPTNSGAAGGYNDIGNMFSYLLTAGVAFSQKSLSEHGYRY